MFDEQHFSVQPLPKSYWIGKSESERQEWTKNFYIFYPQVRRVLVDAGERLDYCVRAENPDAMLVLAETGSGKTRLTELIHKWVLKIYGRNNAEKTICPVLILTVPDPCTPHELSCSVLQGLGASDYNRGTRAEILRRSKLMLKECEVRLVLLDNFHDIPAKRRARGVELVGVRLRYLFDASSAFWLFLGTKDATAIRDNHRELIRRIPSVLQIDYFSISSQTGRKTFAEVLKALDSWLPLAETSCFIEKSLRGRMFVATAGVFDRLVRLVDRAWLIAVRAGRESITIVDLAESFRHVHGTEEDGSNPFSEEFKTRKLNLPGEPYHVLGSS
jgi:hypothetical protein